MQLIDALEAIRKKHGLAFILVTNDEGLLMAHAGDIPDEGFAPYSPMAVETARRMANAGGLGEPVCNALILQHGRMLITHQAGVAGRTIYLSLLCEKVPTGLISVLDHITAEIARALGE